jgi:hypothetical protein
LINFYHKQKKGKKMNTKIFKNETIPYTPSKENCDSPGSYGFKNLTPYLFLWRRLFQGVISQAGTYILTNKFHDSDCGIYKCEGGCCIAGVGELVLSNRSCYFDSDHRKETEKNIKIMADLITYIVLHWNPMLPTDSMLTSAVDFINSIVDKNFNITLPKFKELMEKIQVGGAFSGDPLSTFFDHNPFATFPIDREYERYCLVNFSGKTNEEIDQQYADRDLGEDLLKKMIKKIKEADPNCYSFPLCCSPRRGRDGLWFWINTGRQTQIDGGKTLEQIEEFLKSDGILKDTDTY